jgi:N-acetylmuramoyl-L-alanine amidase
MCVYLAKVTVYMENVLMVDIIAKILMAVSVILLLIATPLRASAEKRPIVLDAGHGGYDTGIISSGMKEKDITLTLVKSLKAALEENYDKKVWLTRKMDQYASIVERRSEANSVSPAMLVSLHLSDSDKAAVYITWYLKGDKTLSLSQYYSVSAAQRRYLYQSKALSRALGGTLAELLEVSIIYREMPVELLNTVAAPAVLIELPSSGIDFENRLGEIVAAIVEGIEAYERGE